jgi:hypothetical protein
MAQHPKLRSGRCRQYEPQKFYITSPFHVHHRCRSGIGSRLKNESYGSPPSGCAVSEPNSAAAAFPGVDQRNAELPRLIGKIVDDAGAGEHDQPNRQRLERLVVALEERGPLVAVELGLENRLRDPAIVGPSGSHRIIVWVVPQKLMLWLSSEMDLAMLWKNSAGGG